MCLVISILMLVLSFNYYNAQNYLLASGSLIVAIFFIILMIRNIMRVKKFKKSQYDSISSKTKL